jgi:hypothetical protein
MLNHPLAKHHTNSKRNRYLVLLAFGLTVALTGCSKKPPREADKRFEVPAAGYPVSVEPSGSKNVDDLVCRLVSQRPAPYPSGYDEPPDAVVFGDYMTPQVKQAIKDLKALGPSAFPALVKHLGDGRYSYSGVVAAWLNFSVGDAVVDVLCDGNYMHSGYKGRQTHLGNAPYLSFKDYLTACGAEAWAERAKSMTRLKIQMDFIDWCIERENERGYVDEAQKKSLLETYESARQRVRTEYAKGSGDGNESK